MILADGSPDPAFELGPIRRTADAAYQDAMNLHRQTGIPVDASDIDRAMRRAIDAWNQSWMRAEALALNRQVDGRLASRTPTDDGGRAA
ncbi:hypothetical protein [Sphingosinicella rhizophila]|uniref:Uncharacterized protein n=1 Tax=Sphingosinicella rhizophila TaxID=3050082 RepID=A0ABU3Q528_9SPHN|nr:hypothetical protein [Sphingosinicella sp. GR2756]MDT9598520.1 hypothetical protein [Sphingosinicella sp. GR2756]